MQRFDPSAETDRQDLQRLPLSEYVPETTLRLDRTIVERPRFPVIDCHEHLGRWIQPGRDWVEDDLAGRRGEDWLVKDVGALVAMLDAHEVRTCINLDGRWGAELEANLDRYDRTYPGRFSTFCHLDWSIVAERDDFAGPLSESLRRSAEAGAQGLKVWKTLGLAFRDRRDELLMPDDERAAPLFALAGELGLPVLIHTADPVAFFSPVDRRNERLEELLAHPEWSFAGADTPSHVALMGSFERLVSTHPGTTFIGAHFAGNVEDLAWISEAFTRYPNLYVDISARIGDLGRQPRTARRLFEQHPDRILFGCDGIPPDPASFHRCFRFLESADEGYPYDEAMPPQAGRWNISALDLPDPVLRSVYYENAERVLSLNGVSATEPPKGRHENEEKT